MFAKLINLCFYSRYKIFYRIDWFLVISVMFVLSFCVYSIFKFMRPEWNIVGIIETTDWKKHPARIEVLWQKRRNDGDSPRVKFIVDRNHKNMIITELSPWRNGGPTIKAVPGGLELHNSLFPIQQYTYMLRDESFEVQSIPFDKRNESDSNVQIQATGH